ncbi:MAG: hypothetical protein Q7J68_07315 [Thermoplasmata archaeon]|nr:hypothetical protein [Thermoplasmata archaeon]
MRSVLSIPGHPPTFPADESDTPTSLLPFIIVPIILVLPLKRRKKTINVTVSEAKQFTPPKGGTRWRYTCTYAGNVIGVTKTTDLQVDVGTVIKVRPDEIREEADGTLTWSEATVIELADKEDSEAKIRKLVKTRKE